MKLKSCEIRGKPWPEVWTASHCVLKLRRSTPGLLLHKTVNLSKGKQVRVSEEQSNSLTEAIGKNHTIKLSNLQIKIKRHVKQEGHKTASETHDKA